MKKSSKKLGYALQPVYPFPLGLSDINTNITPISERADGFIDYPIFQADEFTPKTFKNIVADTATDNDGRLTLEDWLKFGTTLANVWSEAKQSDTTKTQLELQIAQQEEAAARQKEAAAKQQTTTIIISAVAITGLFLVGAFAYYKIKKNK
jgi:hypothetical protein